MTKFLKIAVLGAGGHALSILDAAVSAGFQPVAVVDPHVEKATQFELPLLRDPSSLDLSEVALCLGIGHNYVREAIFLATREAYPGARFPSLIHKTAWVSPTATLSDGTVVLANASVGPLAKTGVGAIVNTGASLDHESLLDDFASLAPGAHTAGSVSIGVRAMIGLNAGIIQGVTIGHDSVIGAHSLVRHDIPDSVIAYGVPCSKVRERKASEPY